jgi:hypothetical protein
MRLPCPNGDGEFLAVHTFRSGWGVGAYFPLKPSHRVPSKDFGPGTS